MTALIFTCPKTKRDVPTGVRTDVEGLRQSWSRTLRLTCPHCGQEHEIPVREAYLNAALDDAIDRIGRNLERSADRSEVAR
jgi:hypothetical protein